MNRLNRILATAVLAVLPMVGACDVGELTPPEAVDELFARYVSLGNSITAGFQSNGINSTTQLESYAVLVARRMGLDASEFRVPLMKLPGCPPPVTNILTGEVVGGATAPPCAMREGTEEFLNNVAVPGAAVVDLLSNLAPTSDPNSLTTFFLGGESQLEAAARVSPTFASVWIGANDWLGAGFARDASLVTDPATYAANIESVTDSLVAMGVEGGVLIGVINIVNNSVLVPHFSAGQFYLGLKMAGQLPATFTVAPSCAPTASGGVGDQTFVPFAYGFGELMLTAMAGTPVTLDCTDDSQVLTLTEVGQISAAILAYNNTLETLAGSLGWAYWDPNPLLGSLVLAGSIPLIPDLTDPTGSPFGTFLSLDGLHPSASAHEMIADSVVAAINAQYGTTIP